MATWEEKRAADIRVDAKTTFGPGWNRLSESQQEDYLRGRVLAVLLSQDAEQFRPAQELVTKILAALTV